VVKVTLSCSSISSVCWTTDVKSTISVSVPSYLKGGGEEGPGDHTAPIAAVSIYNQVTLGTSPYNQGGHNAIVPS
jgi:hypothetical protein